MNKKKMFINDNLVKIILLVSQASLIWALTPPSGYTTILNSYAYMADEGSVSGLVDDCVYPQYPTGINDPRSLSMEQLIDYVERLEDILVNSTDPILKNFQRPDDIARMILQRFHLDEYDLKLTELPQHVGYKLSIDNEILGKLTIVDREYYFPDSIYSSQELCDMFFMFSHVLLNTSEPSRNKRSVYTMERDLSSATSPRASAYSSYRFQRQPNEIKESGVVSFRQSANEAIAPAKVFIGIIAGLADNVKLSAEEIIPKDKMTPDLIQVKLTDPVLATTLANIPGSTAFSDRDNTIEDSLVFGVKGKWIDTACCTYYAIENPVSEMAKLERSSRGTQAQIRGAIDGYMIGSKLTQIKSAGMNNINGLRLSTILRSYYSMPHLQGSNINLAASYCDRATAQTRSLDTEVDAYFKIFKAMAKKPTNINKYELFRNPLQASLQVQSDICLAPPSGNMGQESPCETPSDLIFVVDPKQDQLNLTLANINNIARRINKIGRFAGKISVFVNSETQFSQMPSGTWPLAVATFNATNIGSFTCPFRRNNLMSFSPMTSAGKYFKKLNQTLANYKYGQLKFFTGVPSMNVIIVDYETLTESKESTEREDYENFQDSLRYKLPDARYLVVAKNSNQKLFENILQQKGDMVTDLTEPNIGHMIKRICENPATLTYIQCFEKPSENVRKDIYVTPGYKQNWAMYPEFFLKSFTIEIKLKAVDGTVRYCFDREFPQRQDHCEEIQMGNEKILTITDPCKKYDIRSCPPFYFTFWAKERKIPGPCTDSTCQSMDQVKLTLQHKGISCNSAMRLGSIFFIQIICLVMVYFSSKGFF